MPHRFKLGERISLAFGFHDQDASGLYEVTALLPTRPDGDPQYRVKGSDEREHVIGERQIGAPHSVNGRRVAKAPITPSRMSLTVFATDNEVSTSNR